MRLWKKIYTYILIFTILYMEFGYYIVVSNALSGFLRNIIMLITIFPSLLFLKKVDKNILCLFISLSVFVFFNILRDSTYENYILLLIPIFIAFILTLTYDFKEIIFYFNNLMTFLAIFSLATYFVSIMFPQVIKILPMIGFVYDSRVEMHNAFFSVCTLNPTYFRNYGFTWEPGAYSILLCVALFITLFMQKLNKKRVLIFICTIFTTFSTTGYFCLAIILIVAILRKNISLTKYKKFIFIIIFTLVLMTIFVPKSLLDVTFSKLDGLFSNGESVAYTTESRLNAIKYPFKAFISSPIIGVGYNNFAYLNKYICDGLAVNTIINWFACLGLIFGIPCLINYFNCVRRVSKQIELAIFPTLLVLIFSVLLISTESLLRISFVYVIVFYGCKKNINYEI